MGRATCPPGLSLALGGRSQRPVGPRRECTRASLLGGSRIKRDTPPQPPAGPGQVPEAVACLQAAVSPSHPTALFTPAVESAPIPEVFPHPCTLLEWLSLRSGARCPPGLLENRQGGGLGGVTGNARFRVEKL